jgi:hypothetical protein
VALPRFTYAEKLILLNPRPPSWLTVFLFAFVTKCSLTCSVRCGSTLTRSTRTCATYVVLRSQTRTSEAFLPGRMASPLCSVFGVATRPLSPSLMRYQSLFLWHSGRSSYSELLVESSWCVRFLLGSCIRTFSHQRSVTSSSPATLTALSVRRVRA